MTKYQTQELLDQLKIQGDYPYAAGYLMSFIEGLSYTLQLTAKQDKILRETIENHATGMAIRNEKTRYSGPYFIGESVQKAV